MGTPTATGPAVSGGSAGGFTALAALTFRIPRYLEPVSSLLMAAQFRIRR